MDKKRILVVDDEEEILKVLWYRLNAAGFDVITAKDGPEGYEKACKEKPDLIVLDLMLPKLDGYKVCRMLKFDEKYKSIPIILVTARAEDNDKKLGREVGADAYVTKPYEAEVLLGKISELIRK
jgi:DNA-binding response OmpR family regulator